MRRRVTFSRNLTLSLSRTCRSHCKYCAFATHRAHLHEPDEVRALLNRAARGGKVKELLVLTGDDPDHHPGVRAKLDRLGFADFTAYAAWACAEALERGLLPHTNLGARSPEELARLRSVTASQGLMLESLRPDLVAHQGSPTKDPKLRLATIRAAGELKIPFTSGILVGIGETPADRVAALEALAALHAEHGHLQEVILQNFVPHESYYGREPGEIADEAARRYWRSGVDEGPVHARPRWASSVTVEDMVGLVATTRELMPDVGIQIPPNLADWWPQLVAAGATDLGGLSANGDHISPEHPFPSPTQVRARLARDGIALTERLCAYPRYLDAGWQDTRVLAVARERFPTFVPRGSAPVAHVPRPDLVSCAIERGRDGAELTHAELTALFAERRPEAVEAIRVAADELRAEVAGEAVTYVVNRNLNVSNVCTVGCAFCGFARTKRSPEAYTHSAADFVARIEGAVEYGATELCIQSGIHPDWSVPDYVGWLELARATAPHLHLHAYSPMEVAHMCDVSGRPPRDVLAELRDAGLGSIPGTAAEILDDGVRERISPNKLPVARWLAVVEAAHAVGLPSTSTVMYGHVETPAELATHLRVLRELQARTGAITELVPLSFIPFHTRLGRTHGIEEIALEDSLRHTAVFRLAIGRAIPNLQASWVKLGLEAAARSLDWGVNDLGGTLMEESISRMAGADHGSRRDPADLVAAAHAVGRPAAERTTLYARRSEPILPPLAALA